MAVKLKKQTKQSSPFKILGILKIILLLVLESMEKNTFKSAYKAWIISDSPQHSSVDSISISD